MTNITKKFGTAVATVALLANSFAGIAAAGTTIEISGNGAGSDNWATVEQTSTTTIDQDNTATVVNNVTSDAKTGGNDANMNTGGDVMINTGKASTTTVVENVLNVNSADVECCASGDTEVMISGNGSNSENGVGLNQTSNTTVDQDNTATVTNTVNANAKTGYNDAGGNTGGDVTIKTGNASTDTHVVTVANENSARVSGGMSGAYPKASFVISGNGAGTNNYIGADEGVNLSRTTRVDQDNTATVRNTVDADAKSGGNDANMNTGGDVMIDTGDAAVGAMVDNSVNFNYADVDCGCTWDVMAKIANNGAQEEEEQCRMPHGMFDMFRHGGHPCGGYDSEDNIITLNLDSTQLVYQDNVAGLTNNLTELDAKTGYNESGSNNGGEYTDPSIVTGDASVNAGVSNSGNVNTVGDGWNWPPMPEVEYSFNFAAMMAFFAASFN